MKCEVKFDLENSSQIWFYIGNDEKVGLLDKPKNLVLSHLWLWLPSSGSFRRIKTSRRRGMTPQLLQQIIQTIFHRGQTIVRIFETKS